MAAAVRAISGRPTSRRSARSWRPTSTSAPRRSQALAAINFLYTHVLALPLAQHVDFTRAKRPARLAAVLPTVLGRSTLWRGA